MGLEVKKHKVTIITFVIRAVFHVPWQTKVTQFHTVNCWNQHIPCCNVSIEINQASKTLDLVNFVVNLACRVIVNLYYFVKETSVTIYVILCLFLVKNNNIFILYTDPKTQIFWNIHSYLCTKRLLSKYASAVLSWYEYKMSVAKSRLYFLTCRNDRNWGNKQRNGPLGRRENNNLDNENQRRKKNVRGNMGEK